MRLGADPEVFLQNNAGKMVSVIGYVGAGKENPLQVDNMPKGFTFQEDNVALEFGIPPAASADEFVSHIQSVQQEWLKRKPEFSFSKLSCTIFPEEEMQSPMAHIFGCEPDFNAWTGRVNKMPTPPHPFLRSAGGHIHVETTLNKREVIKAMDLFLGVPSVIMDQDGQERRKLYGKYGAFRPKPYGVEYRTLSNYWIFDEKYIRWAWRATEYALFNVSQGAKVDDWKDDIASAINGGDVKVAERLVKELNLEVV